MLATTMQHRFAIMLAHAVENFIIIIIITSCFGVGVTCIGTKVLVCMYVLVLYCTCKCMYVKVFAFVGLARDNWVTN